MKLDMTFTVTVSVRRYELDNLPDEDGLYYGENTDLDLNMNTLEAGCFLFKTGKNIFKYRNYKVLMIAKNSGEIGGISFEDGKYTYVVRSLELFISKVLAGYEKIRLLEKMAAIAEYAEFTSSAPSDDEVIDEFDLENNEDG